MSSSIHSPPSTSSDVVFLPHPLNHVNHNHTESSPSKSLKRSRSPSLTRDNDNEINDSPIPTETPTKKSRKKRTTTDVDHTIGFVFHRIFKIEFLSTRRHLSADKIYIYRWPSDEPHADLHVLQEQICDYLSLKSFKRKYPGLFIQNIESIRLISI
jgi:hypothetical protein